jgi:hypothetical protein
MKQDWHPDELAQHWTLSAEERELLDSKTSATRLGRCGRDTRRFYVLDPFGNYFEFIEMKHA